MRLLVPPAPLQTACLISSLNAFFNNTDTIKCCSKYISAYFFIVIIFIRTSISQTRIAGYNLRRTFVKSQTLSHLLHGLKIFDFRMLMVCFRGDVLRGSLSLQCKLHGSRSLSSSQWVKLCNSLIAILHERQWNLNWTGAPFPSVLQDSICLISSNEFYRVLSQWKLQVLNEFICFNLFTIPL